MVEVSSKPRTLVSVILATLNEAEYIQSCMASLLAQETPGFDLEILAVDGLSTDGTREFLGKTAASDPRVRVYANEKRTSPSAFNLGLAAAQGEYVCIFGAHTVYSKNYISVCLQEIQSRGAVGCGGRVFTQSISNSLEARLVAFALAHPFGSSRKSFRTQSEGFAHTVNYIVIRKQPLMEIGGYSESLSRNEDNDTNQKLRQTGHKLFCTWKTQCVYHPKSTVRALLSYGYRNGFWNVISFKNNPASMAARHFVPLVFVVALLGAFLMFAFASLSSRSLKEFGVLPLAALSILHLGAGTVSSLLILFQRKFLGALLLPLVFLGFHFAYGLGSLVALVTGARSPDSPPAGSTGNPHQQRFRSTSRLDDLQKSRSFVRPLEFEK